MSVSNTGGDGRVAVLLPLPLAGALDYRVPEGMAVVAGDIVVVPLNGRERVGVAWEAGAEAPIAAERLREVAAVVPGFRLEAPLRRFIDWVASYTLSAPGDVLAMALRPHALAEDRPVPGVQAVGAVAGERLSAARARVLAALEGPMGVAAVAAAAGVSGGLVREMVRAGQLRVVAMAAAAAGVAAARVAVDAVALSGAQGVAAAALCGSVAARRFEVTLLRGATGSGKTEVYFEAVRACIAQGRQALILLPEIALSTQWLRRFAERFGVAPAMWHSEMGAKARRLTWRAAASGAAPVVVGARSALFLPMADLGLVVVDEEHDTGFKQEDGVVYHARDMAVVRARLAEAAVVLVSATPSLESQANVEAGRYARLDLPQRFGGALLPAVAAVDLRLHAPERGAFLSPPLIEAIGATLERGDQVLLFLNRRGYAPLTLCRACGHRVECPNCTAWLVEHRLRRVLVCHHCAHAEPVPVACPQCGTAQSMTAIGPGVERITEEVAQRFPDARRLVMTSDSIAGPHAASVAARSIEERQVDVVIGTQMVAKGWHFAHLALVGVVDADLGLAGGDLRAGERTMQLLHQVAGRAGRAHVAGQVLLQTYQPEHAVMRALVAADLDGFMQAEAAQRRGGFWPPYGRLAALIVSAAEAEAADAVARALGRAAPRGPGVVVLGPAPAPLALLRGRHRRRLLMRTMRDVAVQPLLRRWLAEVVVPRQVRVAVDVDPVSFL